MAYSKKHARGIFCIETVWYGDKDRTSCRPMLQLLEDLHKVPYICRDAMTEEELLYYLTTWKEMKKEYPILYLGFTVQKEEFGSKQQMVTTPSITKLLASSWKEHAMIASFISHPVVRWRTSSWMDSWTRPMPAQ